jgi:hypothetical protein
MSKRGKEYIKNVEDENLRLDGDNDKLQLENIKLKRELEQLRQVNADFEHCLAVIMEKYGWKDAGIASTITKTLTDTAKKLLKK